MRIRNKPVSCRSHRAKVAAKPRNARRRRFVDFYLPLLVQGALMFFAGPIASAIAAALALPVLRHK